MPGNTESRDFLYLAMAAREPGACLERLARHGWRARVVESGDDVLRVLRSRPAASYAGLLDVRGCPADGADVVALAMRMRVALASERVGWVAAMHPEQRGDDWLRALVREYCHDYVVLPCRDRLLAALLGHAGGMADLLPVRAAGSPRMRMEGMVGESAAMQAMLRRLHKAALSEAPVYIAGETGTGKELAAAAIHRCSRRHDRPFVAINCGAIPQGLLQSELFGYERGAFTGAVQRKPGRIETAHGGTLLLDEIGDLPMDSQASLLRFLEEGRLQRLGGREDIAIDVRIISATHVDLALAVADGRFREDLYHRLRVLELQVPPLRERGGDIALIARQALRRHAGDASRRIRGFSPDALQAMHRYAWPGNVRELVNRVREAVVMAEGRYIDAHDLHLDGLADGAPLTLDAARCQSERAAIERALLRNGGRLLATARELGVSRVTLYRLINRHGLRVAGESRALRAD